MEACRAFCTDAYTLLSTITYLVTVTNISYSAVRNVSAEALFGRDITPLEKGSLVTVEKASLEPGESLWFSYQAQINTFKNLDVLLFPLHLLRKLFAGPALAVMWYPFGTDDIYGGASALFDYGTGALTILGEVYKGLGMPG